MNVSNQLIQKLESELHLLEKAIEDAPSVNYLSPDDYTARYKGYNFCVFCVRQMIESDGDANFIDVELYQELCDLEQRIISEAPEPIEYSELNDREMRGIEVGFALCLDFIKMRSLDEDVSLTIETLLWDSSDIDELDYFPSSLPISVEAKVDSIVSGIRGKGGCSSDIKIDLDCVVEKRTPRPAAEIGTAGVEHGLLFRSIAAAPFAIPFFVHIGSTGGMMLRMWASLVAILAIGIILSCEVYKPVVGWVVPFIILAILFNPAFPVYLDRSSWLLLDAVFIGILFLTPSQSTGLPTSIRIK